MASEFVNANLPNHTLRRSSSESFLDHDRAFYDEATQTMSRDELRALQDERVRELTRTALERPIPFFARKLAEAGIEGPDDVKGVDDLNRIPLTVKQELRDSEADHPPVGDYRGTDLRDNIRIGTSTGTTGTPTTILWTRHDLLVDLEAGARMFWRQGIRPGMILTHAHPAYLYAGGIMNTSVYEHMGCLCVWAEPPETDESALKTLEFWQRITPDRPFMGFATGRFIEVANKNDIDLPSAGLDMSKNPPITKDGILPLMTAGAEAMAYLGSACGEVNGGHVCEDFAVIQAVDPDTGEEVPDGQWGNFVITTLGKDNFLVRYDLEEAVRIDRSPCPCGETHLRGWWGGRMKDLLRTQGVSIMLQDLERALRRVKTVREPSLEYVVVRPTESTAPLVVRVEANPDVTDLAAVGAEASSQLSDALGVTVAVEALERDSLPRAGYKATRVVEE
ncbi:MAG: hypothetical protein R3249_04505 [Nitriliruptorales bacterium]|nr:hypothetical protein [Nitriliruptorales bacterium]